MNAWRRGVLAVELIGHAGSRKVAPALVKALQEDKEETVKALMKSAEDSNVEVAAIESLGALSADGLAGEVEEVIKKLDSILLREGRKSIRDAAQAAHDKIRAKPKKSQE